MKKYGAMVWAALVWAMLLPREDVEDEVRVGSITIVGNETTSDNYIRLLIHMRPGGKFSGIDLKETERALKDSNMWDFVAVSLEDGTPGAPFVSIFVSLKEKPANRFLFLTWELVCFAARGKTAILYELEHREIRGLLR